MKEHIYFEKYSGTDQVLYEDIPSNLGMVVVLPCFNEPEIQESITSLIACTRTTKSVELIIVVNSSVSNFSESSLLNNEAIKTINTCFKGVSHIKHHIIHAPFLDKKNAGVGLARKIGMDEAARRLLKANNPTGGIICFDADSTCSPNYLTELEQLFKTQVNGCSIHFEHPLYENEGQKNDHIIAYEIHLRYYKNMLKYCKFPFPYHTIGSSMAVSAEAYLKQGGMNKRKAGEDFYFLHKIFLLEHFKELTTATVYPSARISDRVPFGTGRAMMESRSGEKTINSYHPNAFHLLKTFYESLGLLHESNFESWFVSQKEEIKDFLYQAKLIDQLKSIQSKKFVKKQFLNQICTYFDGFKVLKFCHFYRDHYQGNIPVLEAGNHILKLLKFDEEKNNKQLLIRLRKLDQAKV